MLLHRLTMKKNVRVWTNKSSEKVTIFINSKMNVNVQTNNENNVTVQTNNVENATIRTKYKGNILCYIPFTNLFLTQ